MLREIPVGLEELLGDQAARVIVFASVIDKYFSTGGHLRIFDGIGRKNWEEWVSICDGLVSLVKNSVEPMLAEIWGTATGSDFSETRERWSQFCTKGKEKEDVEIASIQIVKCGQKAYSSRCRISGCFSLDIWIHREIVRSQSRARLKVHWKVQAHS